MRRTLFNLEDKVYRYYRLFRHVRNWPAYLLRKAIGFEAHFRFRLRNFKDVVVPTSVMGTFRECFLGQVYLRHIPGRVLAGKKHPVIIDIGGHVGYFAISVFARFPGALVHSIEPHPMNFQALKAKEDLLGQYDFHAHQLAISDHNGPMTLQTSTLDQYTTLSTVKNDGDSTGLHSVPMTAMRLDTFLEQKHIRQVDFLKVDCEGSEYAILYTLPAKIYPNIASMCIETHEPVQSDQQSAALAHFLEGHGYRVKRVKRNATGYIWAWRERGERWGKMKERFRKDEGEIEKRFSK